MRSPTTLLTFTLAAILAITNNVNLKVQAAPGVEPNVARQPLLPAVLDLLLPQSTGKITPRTMEQWHGNGDPWARDDYIYGKEHDKRDQKDGRLGQAVGNKDDQYGNSDNQDGNSNQQGENKDNQYGMGGKQEGSDDQYSNNGNQYGSKDKQNGDNGYQSGNKDNQYGSGDKQNGNNDDQSGGQDNQYGVGDIQFGKRDGQSQEGIPTALNIPISKDDCTREKLYARLIYLRERIQFVHKYCQGYQGTITVGIVIKQLGLLIFELKQIILFIKAYREYNCIFQFGVGWHLWQEFLKVLIDIFIGLHGICGWVKNCGISIEGEILVHLNDLLFCSGGFLGGLGVVVTGCFPNITGPLGGFFGICKGLGLNFGPIVPFLGPVGLGGLISGY